VPRADLIAKAASSEPGFYQPEWTARPIEAVGSGTDPDMATAQGKLKAARAAENDAMRKLAEQIYGLQIQSGTTVRDFVTQHDEINTQVQAVVAGAIPSEPKFGSDVVTVTVTVSASDVWRVVHSHMEIVQRKG
jgi:hypothetical protein